MNHLPEKLVKLRKHYNYSQNDLSELLGIDTLDYMGLENGRSMVTHAQMKKLASFYHISFEELFRNDPVISLEENKPDDTDEMNLRYFIHEKKWYEKIPGFVKRHWNYLVIAGAVLLLSGVMIHIINSRIDIPEFDPSLVVTDRLSASDSTVIYTDEEGQVKGRGDDSHYQLSDLEDLKAKKVAEGANFSVILKEDGTLTSRGLTDRFAEEIASWSSIVDIAVGDGHIVAADSRGRVYCSGVNTDGQCEISEFTDVRRVFAAPRGTVVVNAEGKAFCTGEVFGASLIRGIDDVKQVACSEDNTVVLKEDGTVVFYARSRNFRSADSWRGITDVACGEDFIAGLDETGHVKIAIDNYLYEKETESWENILAIDAGKDYLVAYDGETLRGIGNALYDQFDRSENVKIPLAQVSDIRISNDADWLTVSFKGVANASGYTVSVHGEYGLLSCYVEREEPVSFEASNFRDHSDYTLSIISKGEGDYEDSQPQSYSFTYQGVWVEPPAVEKFTVDTLIGKTRTNFEAYLKGLGYDMNKLQKSEAEKRCDGDEAIILSVSGLYEGESLSREEFYGRSISYTYCRLEEPDED